MKKFTYKMTVLSSTIVSPRANLAFYDGLEESALQQFKDDSICLTKGGVNIVYPFYRYGEYTEYDPNSAYYYLPGSSIKGALSQKQTDRHRFMVDDVPIPNEYIVLRNLYKTQYLKDVSKACIDVFFPNVGVEMIKAHSEVTGEFYLPNDEEVNLLLTRANEATRHKMGQMCEYLGRFIKAEYKQKFFELQKAEQYLSHLKDFNDIFLLGGYKGLLHSMEYKSLDEEMDYTVFLDPETMLPHGLVKIVLI